MTGTHRLAVEVNEGSRRRRLMSSNMNNQLRLTDIDNSWGMSRINSGWQMMIEGEGDRRARQNWKRARRNWKCARQNWKCARQNWKRARQNWKRAQQNWNSASRGRCSYFGPIETSFAWAISSVLALPFLFILASQPGGIPLIEVFPAVIAIIIGVGVTVVYCQSSIAPDTWAYLKIAFPRY